MMNKNDLMGKYRPNNILTQEQIWEIAVLVNSGVPYDILAEGYGVSQWNINKISKERKKWIPEEDIVTTKDHKFLYAQRAYVNESLSDKAKDYIKDYVFEPVATAVAQRFGYGTTIGFLHSVYGIEFKPTEDYVNMLKGFAVDILDLHAGQGMLYASIDTTVNSVTPFVSDSEEIALTPEQKEWQDQINKKILEVLNILEFRESECIKLRFGIEDGYANTQEEVARILGMTTRSGANYLEAKAISKLRHPDVVSDLENFITQINNNVQYHFSIITPQ